MSEQSGRFTVLHLSDLHVTARGLLYDSVDGIARIDHLARYAVGAGITPEAIIVTGDLVERGHHSAYPAVGEALERLARATGAPVFTVPGNHDTPEAAAVGENTPRTVTVGAVRLVLLDSSSGALGAEQLAWLRDRLAQHHGIGTIVALHHPPLPSPLPSLERRGLADSEAFAEALRDRDVRVVIAGHYHHPMSGMLGEIPVSVGPSLAYHQVMDAGPGRVAGHDSAMFSLLQLTTGTTSWASVSLDSARPLFTQVLGPATAAPAASSTDR